MTRDDVTVATTCVSIAKGKHKLNCAGLIGEKGQQWQLLRVQHHPDERGVSAHVYNQVVRFMAEIDGAEKAEVWMSKLDSTKNLPPDIGSFNALLRAHTKVKDWQKADELFVRTTTPSLHPELGGLRPDHVSFDILIQSAAEAGDVVRAEHYLRLAREHSELPSCESFYAVIYAVLAEHEPRRASKILEELIEKGSQGQANFSAKVVKQQRSTLHRQRSWSPEEFLDVLYAVVRALADTSNTNYADRWLNFVTDCGIMPSDAPDLWEHVRSRTPTEIHPSSLYAEDVSALAVCPTDRCPTPLAHRHLAATLSGEERAADGSVKEQSRRQLAAFKSRMKSGLSGDGYDKEVQAITNVWEKGDRRPGSRNSNHTLATTTPRSSCGFVRPSSRLSSPAQTYPLSARTSTRTPGIRELLATPDASPSGRCSPTSIGGPTFAARRLYEAKRSQKLAERASVARRPLDLTARTRAES